jgi:hypothetical protein
VREQARRRGDRGPSRSASPLCRGLSQGNRRSSPQIQHYWVYLAMFPAGEKKMILYHEVAHHLQI